MTDADRVVEAPPTSAQEAEFQAAVARIAARSPGSPSVECMGCGSSFSVFEGHLGDDATLCRTCCEDD